MYFKSFLFLITILIFTGCSSREYTYSQPSSSRTNASGEIKNSPNMHRATMKPYTVLGKTYYPTQVSVGDSFSGISSWYGKDFHNKKTSNGEYYNMYDMTAAHKTLPMNTMLKVTNIKNNRQIIVRVNDRGPFVQTRIIDLSNEGAKRLDMIKSGTIPVRIEVIGFNGTIGTVNTNESVVIDDYLVQIGAFRNKNGAYSYSDKYQGIEGRYSAFVKAGEKGNMPLYRVYLKGFGSEVEARDFIEKSNFSGSFIARD